MSDAWKLLKEFGLPDGAPRPPPTGRIDPVAIRVAVLEVARSADLTVAKVAPLLAWLSAWHHHWPARFAAVFGGMQPDFLTGLQDRLDDQNRYLKLRRIAIANLAHIL